MLLLVPHTASFDLNNGLADAEEAFYETLLSGGFGPEVVLVPAGNFVMNNSGGKASKRMIWSDIEIFPLSKE